jgi:hypothetical protein
MLKTRLAPLRHRLLEHSPSRVHHDHARRAGQQHLILERS